MKPMRLVSAMLLIVVVALLLVVGCGEEKAPTTPQVGIVVVDQRPDQLSGAG